MNLANIGERIKKLRVGIGLNQKELAEKIGVHSITISKYENGAYEPSKEILAKLANIFNVSANYLLTGSGNYTNIQKLESIVSEDTGQYQVGYDVKIVGDVSAGPNSEIYEEAAVMPSLRLPFPDCKGAVGFYVSGDSMEDLYSDGDVLIIKPRHDAPIHEGNVYVVDYEQDGRYHRTVKYVFTSKNGYRLRSKNGKYPDYIVTDVFRFYRIIREIRGFTDQLA